VGENNLFKEIKKLKVGKMFGNLEIRPEMESSGSGSHEFINIFGKDSWIGR